MIETIVSFTGMEEPTVWEKIVSLTGTLLGVIVPYVLNKRSILKQKKEERKEEWKIDKEYKENWFYAHILIWSYILSLFLLIYIYGCIGMEVPLLIILLSVGIVLSAFFVIVNKSKSVRLARLSVGKRKTILFVNAPMILLMIGMSLSLFVDGFWDIVCMLLMVILEVKGICEFYECFIIYENSYVDIYLDNAQIIRKLEIETIKKDGKWVIGHSGDETHRFKMDKIVNTKGYGEKIYIEKNYLKTLFKRSKRRKK